MEGPGPRCCYHMFSRHSSSRGPGPSLSNHNMIYVGKEGFIFKRVKESGSMLVGTKEAADTAEGPAQLVATVCTAARAQQAAAGKHPDGHTA